MAKMQRVLGLDVGITSVGFALLDLSENKIVKAGVHCFDKAENPKNGASLAFPRRVARGQRRRIRRRVSRLRRLSRLFIANGWCDGTQFEGLGVSECPWKLRSELLNRRAEGWELARVVYHIAKHRGFRSSKKVDCETSDTSASDEMGKVLDGSSKLEQAFRASGKLTIGDYLYFQSVSLGSRKTNSSGSYEHTILRRLHEEELEILFGKQRSFGFSVSRELEAEIAQLAFSQLPLRSSRDLVGGCSLMPERDEDGRPKNYRAAKACYSVQRFVLLQKLNNLYFTKPGMKEISLSPDQVAECLVHAFSKSAIKIADVRKILGVDEDYICNYINSRTTEEQKKEENKAFFKAESYHKIRKATAPKTWELLSVDISRLDAVAEILTFEQDGETIERGLKDLGFDGEDVERLASLSFSGTSSVSLKAIRMLEPYLLQGMKYTEACEQAGFNLDSSYLSENRSLSVPPFSSTRNPVVDRALSQSRKIINAVIRTYGMPTRIHVELARDLGRSFKKRGEIHKEQEDNRNRKEQLRCELRELTEREPTGDEVFRYRLWKEQAGVCPYSGKYMEVGLIADGTALEVDHAIPYSDSFNDSWNNKLLVFADQNRHKGNRIPYEYLNSVGNQAWERFVNLTKFLPAAKRRNISRESVSEATKEEWKTRHLNDTRYIAKELRNHLQSRLQFVHNNKNNVRVRTGQLTAYLRRHWGVAHLKNREADDRHHALDAIVVACASEEIASTVSWYSKRNEQSLHRLTDRFPLPWESFRQDVVSCLDEVFVSRLRRNSFIGAAHEATVYSQRVSDGGCKQVVQRISLEKLTLRHMDKLFEPEKNFRLYDVLRKRIASVPKNPFAVPVYMPTNSGDQGPQVKRVKIVSDIKSGIRVGGRSDQRVGISPHEQTIRLDVFKKDRQFFYIPVYVADFWSGQLPVKICKAGVDEDNWPALSEGYVFCFSLYRNDYIEAELNTGSIVEGYYVGFDRAGIKLKLSCHQHPQTASNVLRPAGTNLLRLSKYRVDYFGNRYEVTSEKRHGLENSGRCKNVKTASQGIAATD